MNYLKTYIISLDEENSRKNRGQVEEIMGTTLAKLEAAGFEGVDMSLDISLLEYGMAWAKDGDDWHFIFRRENFFDNGTYPVSTNWKKEFGWISPDDLASFLDYVGSDEEEFDSRPFPQQVYDLTNYWGWENIFGGCYWQGFYIFKDGRNRVREYFDIVNGVNSY